MQPFSQFEWDAHADGFAIAVAPPGSVLNLEPEWAEINIQVRVSPPRTRLVTRAEWLRPGAATEHLTRVLIPRTPGRGRSYRPMVEHPGLFRRFVELDDKSDEAIIGFASQFGPLMRHAAVVPPWHPEERCPVPKDSHYNDIAVVKGDLVDDWLWLLRPLRGVVRLHEAIISTDLAAIHELISVALDDALHDVLLPHLDPDSAQADPLEIAKALRNAGMETGLHSRIVPKWSEDKFHMVPTHLLGAMWLQAAVGIEEGKQFRKCPARNCPTVWFEVSTGPLGVREDAEFCSARCRHTAYRDRKTSARQMHGDGVSVKEIAKSLKTDVRRVRTWLGKK